GAGGVVTYRAVHPWLARHRYGLGIVVRSGTVRLLDVERALPDALGAVLDQTRPRGGDSPYRRHVPRGGDVREALVLVAPGRARWGVDVPEGGARLTLALGHLVPERAGRVEVTVQVTGRAGTGTSGEVVRLEATLENPAEAVLAGGDDVEPALGPLAGEAAEVVLEARTSGRDEEVAVAFAHPTVAPRRDASRPRPPDVVLA